MKDNFLDMFDFNRDGKLDLVEKAFLFDAVDSLMRDDGKEDGLFEDDLFDDDDEDED